jgi:signal peptidase
MGRKPLPRPKPEENEAFWKGLARDGLIALIIVAVILGAMYAYAGNWPPLVVVESSSMQHGNAESSIGVIDTGDMVFQQAAPNRDSVITYIQGRAQGVSTYGDYGDVIIFRRASDPTPVIHRAIMYVTFHADGTADVLDIVDLPDAEWEARNATGLTRSPFGLESLLIRNMGYDHNVDLTFTFDDFLVSAEYSGYITKGDNNAGYDTGWVPRVGDIQGRARGEIPWIGLIKLIFQPGACCPSGWGDSQAPKNSWDGLLVTLIILVSLPFLLEYAGRGWTKYVSPRLPEIRWPWRRPKTARNPTDLDMDPVDWDDEIDSDEPPREGSSGP